MAAEERLKKSGERPGEIAERQEVRGQRMAGEGARLICASGELADGGDGLRFEIEHDGETVPAFAIRHAGRVHAYLNRCAHIAMELDWNPGKFLDTDGEYLICSTHGALYAPESGACRSGPCRGAGLTALRVFEADGRIYVVEEG